METKIKCPWCSEQYTIDKSVIGQKVKCEVCGETFTAGDKKIDFGRHSSNYSTTSKGNEDFSEKIKDFFDFKIMVTPFFVRNNFLFLFIGGTIAIIILPLNYTWEKINTLLFIFLYFVYLVIAIPLLALTLHAFYEWTMIPFSILNILKEIRNKLDEKTKS